MALPAGTRLGAYQILDKLGEGGMGEVYRAADSHLKREVAIKVLPASVATDAERLARFQREAEVLAALNHPNIAAIYGLEKTPAFTALVMELVDGEDLSQRIARGRLPIDEALPIAKQIAEALETAHEQGIVHRDLKPANIKVRADGTVKVLDFGLARWSPASSDHGSKDPGLHTNVANSPTMTSPAMPFDFGSGHPELSQGVTAMGMILGTAAYMSPEQARGKTIDKRADIWAFGAVLYEMLAGRRLFPGDEISDVLAAVLRQDIDWSALPATTPSRIRQLLARCLDRDVKTRLRDIGEARVLLASANTSELSAQSPAMRPWLGDARSILVLAALVVTVAVAGWLLSHSPGEDADPFPGRFEISGGSGGAGALSPDGRTVVFTAGSAVAGNSRILVRRLDQLTARAIPGTENLNASEPIFSPDGREILFVAKRHTIMRMPLDGAPVPVAELGELTGGLDWSNTGEIVAGTGTTQGLTGLMRVKASGGSLREFTHVDASRGELSHQYPRVLADGKTVLFTIWHGSIDQAELAAVSLDNEKVVRLGILAGRALGVIDDQLVYAQAGGGVMAVPFDVATLRPTGTAIPLQNGLATGGGAGTGVPRAFLSHAGGLVFAVGQAQRRLVWVDAAGRVSPAFGEMRGFTFVRLSPDGRHAAVTIDEGASSDIWVLDLVAGDLTRITSTGQSRNPSWSPDSRRVFYTSTHGGRSEFWWQPIDGSGPPVKAGVPPYNPWWTDVSPDEKSVIFNGMYASTGDKPNWNLATFALDGEPLVRDFVAMPTAAETMARFSPDGTLVAYLSDDSGPADVYVKPLVENGSRVKISQATGRRPVWSHDGSRIFYFENRQLMSASIARQPSLHVTSRGKLFEWSYPFDLDVAKDGRFLLVDQIDEGQRLIVVPNWRTELRRLTSGKGR